MEDNQNIKSAKGSGDVSTTSPSTEVRPARRSFTADYKRRILEELDACEHGQAGALMRREGLYSSHLETWRRQRDAGELAGLAPKKRGRKPHERNPLQPEVDRLRRETRRLQERLRQAEAIIDVQKKVSALLGLAPAAPKDES